MEKRLWYDSWTEEYMEGLPTGNGRLAAMMLGRPERLRIALNHEWMWRGENRFRAFPDVSAHLPEVREALLQGDFLRGTELANRYFGGVGGCSGRPNRVDPYQPVGDVWIERQTGSVSAYSRCLDLDTGLACVEYDDADDHVRQQMFVSCNDGLLMMRMTTGKPGDADVVLSRREDPRCTVAYEEAPEGLRMIGAFTGGICFETRIKIETDGVWGLQGNRLKVCGATEVILGVQIGTDAKGERPEREMTFPENLCFDELFRSHAGGFLKLKGDADLTVDVPHCGLPTDRRIRLFRDGGDPALPLLYFEYGRYLLASGSSGELPLNLQGKWNEALQPPWSSDYHLDINLQMCYWFAETLGMDKASETLFSLIERFVPYGRVMARNLYNCRGFTMTLQTDVWGRVTPESCGYAVWVGAAPWLGRHLFMHWRYTGDVDFLKARCYPYLKACAEFFEDYLMERDGQLWIIPSQSPENRFEGTGNWPVSIGVNCAMDIELVTELMHSAAECADILDIDPEKAALWREIAQKLPKLSIDADGRLNEWDCERPEVEPGHRHLSHLYGLYPSELFEPGSREWRAAERSLDSRLSHGGGHTGWSRSWTACMMARLGRGEDAWQHFIALIADFATVSLLDLHPPRIFQIDGNMGGTACVCEMLMQSRRDRLHLLPALPKAWKKGSVRNFRAQDGVTVSFEWENGELTSCVLRAGKNLDLQVISGEKQWTVALEAGKEKTLLP